MTNEAIADALKLTSQLMELHGENPFKVKALGSAAYRLDKTGIALEGKTVAELEAIEGIGKSIAGKIFELQQTGTLKELSVLLEKTPAGVIDMLGIKGIGPKKVAQLWKELGVESPGELLYACNENRLVDLKGFGQKTQLSVQQAIEFSMQCLGKFHYYAVEDTALRLVEFLEKQTGTELVSLTGHIRRRSLIIEEIEVVVAAPEEKISLEKFENPYQVALNVITCEPTEFAGVLFTTSASQQHMEQLKTLPQQPATLLSSEEEIYKAYGLAYIEPELREGCGEILLAQQNKLPKLIEETDLRGILHNHSKWSDGINTVEEMALRCQSLGKEYFGICDHSQTAVYAGGLKPDRVLAQQQEIDALNAKLAPFRIFKGIESDILYDGSLDYTSEILATFDFVVASVHSGLKMDLEKATARLIRAIENPFTTILGHPTGRLLLSRSGYPIDHKKVIDACAANGVAIELNAHPYRLDIDWHWIPYCMEKGVPVSINPDAHDTESLLDIRWGTLAARKGMLTKENCLNAKNLAEITEWFRKKNPKLN
jgi:DNA polymerase (family X)